jgi:hypothetical protein
MRELAVGAIPTRMYAGVSLGLVRFNSLEPMRSRPVQY